MAKHEELIDIETQAWHSFVTVEVPKDRDRGRRLLISYDTGVPFTFSLLFVTFMLPANFPSSPRFTDITSTRS